MNPQGVISPCLLTYEKRGKQHFHSITVDEYYDDLKSIENPIAIYDGWDKVGKKGRPRINLKKHMKISLEPLHILLIFYMRQLII